MPQGQASRSRNWRGRCGRRERLRGPVDPADFKAYIFPLLFFKRIGDAWERTTGAPWRTSAGTSPRRSRPTTTASRSPRGATGPTCAGPARTSASPCRGRSDRIQEANPETLAGIFGDVAWGNKERLPETALLNLIEAFDKLDLDPEVGHDVLGGAYEYLLKQFADESGKKAGEFFTPARSSVCSSRILDPQPGETVYDPACGSGGMLVETINEVIEAGGSIAARCDSTARR